MPKSASPVRFGVFEADLRSGELRKNGFKLRLEGQPMQVLKLLLERPGELVTREELKQTLWSADTFVDFEVSINAAVKRLRHALDDSADTPRYIETLPKRGYRFVYPVQSAGSANGATTTALYRSRPFLQLAGAAVVLAIATFLVVGRWHLGRAADARIRSIAVLPLENLTGDAQQEYFVDGIHDELTTRLAQVAAVTSRTSVLQYRQQTKPLREIARELGVDGILKASVRVDGDSVHVTVQLISARNDRPVWAQSYDRERRDWPALTAEITRAVAHQLDLPLTPQEQLRLANPKPVDPAVYVAYLKGSYFMQKWTSDGLMQALDLFREAIGRDPGYAPAWGAMGECYEMLGGFAKGKELSREEALRRAQAALERAVALDPQLRQPHQVLGRIWLAAWDWEGAQREFERAHELDPDFRGFSAYLLATGRFDEAVKAQRRVAELDPFNYSAQLTVGYTAFIARRYDESIVALKKTVALNPDVHHAHYELAWNYAKKGMYAEAIAECENSLALLRRKQPDAVVATGCGWVYALAGRRSEALDIAQRLEKLQGDEEKSIQLAHLYDALGQRERALTFLEKAYNARAAQLPRQWASPMTSDALLADPRFQALMRRTGIPWMTAVRPQSFASASSKVERGVK